MSGVETEADGDATDVEGAAAAAAGEGGDAGALTADLPAELSALVMAANTDQSELPDLFGDPQIFGERQQPCAQHTPRLCQKDCGFPRRRCLTDTLAGVNVTPCWLVSLTPLCRYQYRQQDAFILLTDRLVR